MKRRDFLKHLLKQGCVFVREGGKHSVFLNPGTKRISTVPRHPELDDFLAKKICRDLGIEEPKK
ncbi:MAG TPA: type II toxin-antitoxin system HicA family toxin [Candidatus Paceibacterota bacterium]|nr:type II toxin-antitoxin system HicA family toxin [Candidatus Paceibacterota bacterium]